MESVEAKFKAAMIAAAGAVVQAKDLLTRADQAIGDGDHGIGMARGFRAFSEAIEKIDEPDVVACFTAGGRALMMTSGGASGAIFGTFFTAAGKGLPAGIRPSTPALAAGFAAGLQAVKDRGKAKAGDKTMIDAAEPATAALVAAGDLPLGEALAAAAAAARAGAEATRGMVATTGKAKALGARSLGHPDPGALTFTIYCERLASVMA